MSELIDPRLSAEEKIRSQGKIIDALISRIETGAEVRGSHFAIFQSAVALQNELQAKTKRLEEVQHALGHTSDQLQSAYHDKERARKNLADVLEVMEEGFALFAQGRLVTCNERFRTLFPDISHSICPGLSFDRYIQLVSHSHQLDFPNEEAREEWREFRRKMHDKSYSSFMLPLIGDRWYQISDRRTSFGNIAILQTDVSAIVAQNRKEKDRLIHEHQRYVQGAFDHLALGVASFSENWRLQAHNQQFSDLLSLPMNLQTGGISIVRMIEFLNAKILRDESVITRNKNGDYLIEPLFDRAHQLIRNDGTVLEAEFHRHPQEGFIVNIRDISAEEMNRARLHLLNETLEEQVKERTSELQGANKKLRKQNRDLEFVRDALQQAKNSAEAANVSKTRFLAAASHDLLQPVNAAKLFISMLADEPDAAKSREYIRRLELAFNNVETLLHDILDISRLDAQSARISLRDFRLEPFLSRICESFRPLARQKNIRLALHVPNMSIRSDPHYLGRIVQNLIANAIQYTSHGGVLVGARGRGNQVCIEVWDSGRGIAGENLERIFGEFTRLEEGREKGNGIGLGLSIVERACHLLGHNIEVKSRLGRGSLFRVNVPLATNSTPAKSETDQASISHTPETEKQLNLNVVLIENDQHMRFATKEMLERWGMRVLAAHSSDEAIAQCARAKDRLDLIIADYQLDGGDNGVRAIRAIRKKCAYILPAIMITANKSDVLRKSAVLFDFDILAKPIEPVELYKLINSKGIKE